jgi:acetyltransferase-like isoleucine patch superfamily enzyme
MTSDGHNIVKHGERINSANDISIGCHVWLADNVTVLKGASIGDQSIVGINSTLTKPIGSGVIAVGNPAKVVQDEVSWQHELTY